MKKRNQHYVFRAYLKPWSKSGGIHCLRQGTVFGAKLTGVACERFFYRLEELTPREIELIELAIIEPSPEPTKAQLRRFLNLYCLAPKMKRLMRDSNAGLAAVLDELIVNSGENYHQKVEDSLLIYLRSMLAGSLEFYEDAKQAALFLYALAVQYTRTKQVRETALSRIGRNFHGCDTRRIWGALSHIIAMNLGESLYRDRERFSVVLVDNESETPLVTGDQPIINLHATFNGRPPDRLEFFYPLSPTRAMLLVERSRQMNNHVIGAVSANSYNMQMIQNSHEQVFSDSEEYLASIRHLVCDEGVGRRLKT